MVPQHLSWPDIDGAPVSLGDWVQVFCSWSRLPKFDGRSVQVIDVLRGGGGAIFRVHDPESGQGEFYLSADGRGYRRVPAPSTLN
jgi:hypothetical protein